MDEWTRMNLLNKEKQPLNQELISENLCIRGKK